MALYTMQNLVLLTWAHFAVIFGAPALGLAWAVIRDQKQRARVHHVHGVLEELPTEGTRRAA